MDAMVSARVPVEIKKRGDSKLREIGSSATELVNAAYDYVIKCGKLPGVEERRGGGELQMKVLSGEEARSFMSAWNKQGVIEARGYDSSNFKDALDQARDDYHARFA